MSAARPSKIVPRFAGETTGKPAATKRNGTASGKRHMGRVAELPCALCTMLGQAQTSKSDVHHVRTGAGAAQRNSDFLTIPLCHDGCHQGQSGIHGDKSLMRVANVTELDLLAITIETLLEEKAGLHPPESDPTGRKASEPGAKMDCGKVRVDLVIEGFDLALQEVAKVATFGAVKYSEGGWKAVEDGQKRYRAAGDRHRLQRNRQSHDDQSQLPHLAHEAWNRLAELQFMLEKNHG